MLQTKNDTEIFAEYLNKDEYLFLHSSETDQQIWYMDTYEEVTTKFESFDEDFIEKEKK